MTPSEIHNRLTPEILKRIVTQTGGESEAMVVMESVILGLMLYFRPRPQHAAEYLDVMTARVIERMHDAAG